MSIAKSLLMIHSSSSFEMQIYLTPVEQLLARQTEERGNIVYSIENRLPFWGVCIHECLSVWLIDSCIDRRNIRNVISLSDRPTDGLIAPKVFLVLSDKYLELVGRSLCF